MDFDEALDRVYSASPKDFVQVRTELVAVARQADDAALAKRIGALRKPTVAASAVNRQVHAERSVRADLASIGDRLRAAQGSADGIDRGLLRALSTERRDLVQDVSARALEAFAPSAGSAIHDEVVATFDAAVADPEVAARLGRLTRSEHWSGFGVVSDAGPAPELKVVPGGRSRPKAAAATQSPRPAGRARSALAAAEKKLSAAQDKLDDADNRVAAARSRVGELTGQLDEMQRQLNAAERDVKVAVTEQRSARSRHREAQSARNRAARRSDS